MADYQIKLDAFEGPMDLLMHLIEKNQINIYDIPIAEITQQYLYYLDQFREFNIDIASEFLVMAATLLQIKSRILLPKQKVAEEESGESELDPRQELVERLLEYRRFKEISAVLDQLADEQAKLFFRMPQQLPAQYAPLEKLNAQVLFRAFQSILEANADHTALVSREEFSIQDKMEDILFLLHRSEAGILFTDAFTRAGTKAECIATFLALLELMKLKRVIIEQQRPFSSIHIRFKGGGSTRVL